MNIRDIFEEAEWTGREVTIHDIERSLDFAQWAESGLAKPNNGNPDGEQGAGWRRAGNYEVWHTEE